MRRRVLGRSDAAVSEVLGYVLMLFLSTAILVLSLQAFLVSREATATVHVASELRIIAERVSAQVLQAGTVASGSPNATYTARVALPALGGVPYYVNASADRIFANTTDGRLSAESRAFQVHEIQNLHVHGTVYGSQGYADVRFRTHASGWRTIELTI